MHDWKELLEMLTVAGIGWEYSIVIAAALITGMDSFEDTSKQSVE